MKNASQIIVTLQNQPQYKRILQHKCVKKLTSILLPAIQKSIKYGYVKESKLHFVTAATLDKYDRDNIINTIKTILNGKMIQMNENLIECVDLAIEDVIVRVDHKPQYTFTPYTTNAELLYYPERSRGEFVVSMQDPKLQAVAQEIQAIIKERI